MTTDGKRLQTIISTDKLEVLLGHEGDDVILTVNGALDGDAILTNITLPKSGRLVLDLGGVSLINSLGLRHWCEWMLTLADREAVVFRKCRRNVMDPVNILEGFLPKNGEIESFFVPYYCENCDLEDEVLYKTEDTFVTSAGSESGATSDLPEFRKCPQCQGQMEIDVVPSKYIRFLKYRGQNG